MFARYIAALYYNCPLIAEHRTQLAINLYEEETGRISGTAGHLQLLEKFIFALWITRAELDSTTALPSTKELIEYRRQLVEEPATFHMAAAAIMIASEGQNIESHGGKMRHDWICSHYALDPDDLIFFSVHAVEDIQHVQDGFDLVSRVCVSAQMQDDAVRAINQTCDRFWKFYTGLLSTVPC